MPKENNLNGWIHIHRKLLDWEWWDDPNTFRVFMYLLLKASFRDAAWHGTPIPAGSLITGIRSLAKATRLSVRSVRTALEHLKTTHEVTIETTRQFSLIKINKWSEYQDTDQQSDTRPAHDRHTTDNIVRRVRRVRREERDTGSSDAAPPPTPREEAEAFFKNPEAVQKVIDWCVSRGTSPEAAKEEMDKFVSYWTEPTPNGKRQRWQTERTFEVKRRLVTWLTRASQRQTQIKPSQQWHVIT